MRPLAVFKIQEDVAQITLRSDQVDTSYFSTHREAPPLLLLLPGGNDHKQHRKY